MKAISVGYDEGREGGGSKDSEVQKKSLRFIQARKWVTTGRASVKLKAIQVYKVTRNSEWHPISDLAPRYYQEK